MLTKEKQQAISTLQDKIYKAIMTVGDIEVFMAEELPNEFDQLKPTIYNIIDQLNIMDETQESWQEN